MLSYYDKKDFAPSQLVKRREYLVKDFQVGKLFAQACPEGTPTAQTAHFWVSNTPLFVSLCERHLDTLDLLALGVPTDLISENIPPDMRAKLPPWQSGLPCKHVGAAAVHVQLDAVTFHCPACGRFLKVVP